MKNLVMNQNLFLGKISLMLSLLMVFNFSSQAQEPGVKPEIFSLLGDVAKDENGKILKLDFYRADQYCKKIGSRLPSAIELARYAQSLGAEGVATTRLNDDYKPFYVYGQETVAFYYSRKNYKPSSNDSENYWLWSSTYMPVLSNSITVYVLNNTDGVLNNTYRVMGGAVRCILSH